MLEQYRLLMPSAVYGGKNALANITSILRDNAVKTLAVFTDKTIRAAGLLTFAIEQAGTAGVQCEILDNLPPEPTYAQAQAMIDQCKAIAPDFIMAVGGGSVMDTAKLASVLLTDQYGVKELLEKPGMARKCVKTLLIPTTAGTGSEATPNAIVAVPEKDLKVGIVNSAMMADYAILDGEMIRNLPHGIAAATGIDALAHAIECFTGNKANPMSDLFALGALELILSDLERACDDPDALDAKNNMLIASFYAGAAIAASGTTAVHALSYPLGGKYHIAHGVSNAMLLLPVLRFNEPACLGRLAAVYDRCLRGAAVSDSEKGAAVLRRLEEIVRHLGIPKSMREFGVGQEALDDLVEAGMQVTRLLDNNPRKVTPRDAREIYLAIL